MLNQVQHDIKKEPDFRKLEDLSKRIIKSNNVFDHLVILDSSDKIYICVGGYR
jgi:hypothetical protein